MNVLFKVCQVALITRGKYVLEDTEFLCQTFTLHNRSPGPQ